MEMACLRSSMPPRKGDPLVIFLWILLTRGRWETQFPKPISPIYLLTRAALDHISDYFP